MKIEMKTVYAGPNGNYKPGQVVDMEDQQAKDLIKGGYAVPYVDPQKAADEKAKADKKAADEKAKADKKSADAKAKAGKKDK